MSKPANTALSDKINSTYSEDYGIPLLESLFRNLGEEKAVKLLKSCSKAVIKDEEEQRHLHLYPSVVKGNLKRYMNIEALRRRALHLYKDEEGIKTFNFEAIKYSEGYGKVVQGDKERWKRTNQCEFTPEKMEGDNREIRFKACYYLAWIHQMHQRDQIVGRINEMIREKDNFGRVPTEWALSLCLSEEGERSFESLGLVQNVIVRFFGLDLLGKIESRSEIDFEKIKLKMMQ